RFSRLKPTPAEALAGTVEALAATAALPRAAEASEAPAPSVWRVSAEWALGLAPSVPRVSAARELAAAPSAWRASAGRTSEAARSQAAVSPGAHWRRRASRRHGSPAAALPPLRPARSRDTRRRPLGRSRRVRQPRHRQRSLARQFASA